MAKLISVLNAATGLSKSLFDHAEYPRFQEIEQEAFGSDALRVVSATQALAVSPGFGSDSPNYDAALRSIDAATTSSGRAVPGNALSIHQARLEVVQAVAAMKAVTAQPAVAVS